MIHCQDPSGLPPLIAHELRHYARLAPDKVRGKCYMVSHEIARWFSELTVVVGAAEWSGTPVVHYWLECDGRAIDPTRQQFGSAPEIGAILVVRGNQRVTTVYRGDDIPELEDVPNLPADGRAAWKAALTYVQERAEAGDRKAAQIAARLRDEGTIFAAYGIRG